MNRLIAMEDTNNKRIAIVDQALELASKLPKKEAEQVLIAAAKEFVRQIDPPVMIVYQPHTGIIT